MPKRGICKYYKSGSYKFGQRGEGCDFTHPRKCFKYMKFGGNPDRGCMKKDCEYFHSLCRLIEAGKPCKREKCRYLHRKGPHTKTKRTEVSFRTSSKAKQQPVPKTYTNVDRTYGVPSVTSADSRGTFAQAAGAQCATPPPNTFQLDFRLLQQQMACMERQINYILDMRDSSGRPRKCICH